MLKACIDSLHLGNKLNSKNTSLELIGVGADSARHEEIRVVAVDVNGKARDRAVLGHDEDGRVHVSVNLTLYPELLFQVELQVVDPGENGDRVFGLVDEFIAALDFLQRGLVLALLHLVCLRDWQFLIVILEVILLVFLIMNFLFSEEFLELLFVFGNNLVYLFFCHLLFLFLERFRLVLLRSGRQLLLGLLRLGRGVGG